MLLILTVVHLNFVFPVKKEIRFLTLPCSHCRAIAGASTQTVGVVSNQLFFSEVRAHGLLFLIWLMKQVCFYRGLFFSYTSLLKLMLPCRDNRVAAGQNTQTEHEKNIFYQIFFSHYQRNKQMATL